MMNVSRYYKKESIKSIKKHLNSYKKKECCEINITKGIFIYGAGDLGKLALDYCEHCKIKVLGFIDHVKDGFLFSRAKNSYFIKKPDQIDRIYKDNYIIAISIANYKTDTIISALKKNGWEHPIPFYDLTKKSRNGHPLRNGWKIGNVNKMEMDCVEFICHKLYDVTSLKHYESFIAWHSNSKEICFKNHPISPNQRYTIPIFLKKIIKSNRKNLFVDVGSHFGQAVKKFTDLNIYFNRYFLIEPDKISRNFLNNNKYSFLPINSKVTISRKILGKYEKLVPFKENLGYCSQIWNKSEEKFLSSKFDSLNLFPDLVKIHTEGSELSILLGAKETILNCNPFLVFSVYHRREGFYSDISTPMKIFKNYNWIFRLHNYQGTGAFIYGIPKI